MKQPGALERFVDRLRLRSALSKEEAGAILALPGREVRSKARTVIVRPGQTIDFACLVVQGVVGRFDQLLDRTRQITALHIAGDMCDLHSVAVPHAGWGIEALTPATTFRVPHADLRKLASAYPAIALAFWRDTIVDASVLAKWVSAIGRRKANARLAHLICEMGVRMEQARLGRRTRFELALTQTQLADVLGLTLTHVHSCLTALRREGVLDIDGYEFRVNDLPHLEEIAQFDPAYLLLDCPAVAPPAKNEKGAPVSRSAFPALSAAT